MNTPVNFEIAKLLKEKGFDIPTEKCYAEERLIDKNTGGDLFTGVFRLCTKSRFHKRYYYAPTIAQVIMWLYEKHSLHIEILLEEDAPWSKFYYRTMKVGQYFALSHNGIYKDSPTEAYEAGIEYTLNNLIKPIYESKNN